MPSLTEGDFALAHRANLLGFRRKVTRITSAELLALNATAKLLVPAPGRGRALLLDEARVQYIPGTVEYVSGAGAGAVTNRIVTSVNLTNVALTIAAQPLTPSYITFTIVDTTPSITAGTVTIVGTDRNGNAITEIADVAKTGLTFRSLNVFQSITSVTAASFTVLGGAGNETIVVGTEPETAEDLAIYYGTLASGKRVATLHSQGFFRGAEATDLTAVVASVNLTNAALTLTAEAAALPRPANILVTLVDTTPSITAGTVTITGTAEDGGTQSEVLTFVSGTLSYVTQRAFASVTSVRTAGFTVLGGAGDETIRVGTTAGAKLGVMYREFTSVIPPENTALVLAMDVGELASGNGTIVVETVYRIVPLAVVV